MKTAAQGGPRFTGKEFIPVAEDVRARLGMRTIGITMRENWLPSGLQSRFLEHLRRQPSFPDF